jgi:GntR family transcriptional regulator/MocR family aminotransferase
MDVEAGIRLAPDALLVLVTPARQFPLGMPLDLSRRLALLEWSQATGALILEDDYDSELRFRGRPLPSLLSLNPDANVLLLGGFSKLTFQGLRLSYIVARRELAARVRDDRARCREVSPVAAQSALATFMETGAFSSHLRRLRRVVLARGNALSAAIQSELGDRVRIWQQEVGMHVTAELTADTRKTCSDRELAMQAARLGISLSPLSMYSLGRGNRHGFVLGYAAWNNEVLVDRVRSLARLFRRE